MAKPTPTLFAVSEPQQPIEELIRTRAYELYESRGKLDGFDIDDWVHAEREILGAKMQGRAA